MCLLTVWSRLSLRSQNAGILGSEDSGLGRIKSVSEFRLVVVGGEDGRQVTGLDATLLDELVSLPGAPLNGLIL